MLNKKSEFISKCLHINKRLLIKVKDYSNDYVLKCVCFEQYVLFILLTNLYFYFIGKNIV